MARFNDEAFAPTEFVKWEPAWYSGGIVESLSSKKGDKVTRTEDHASNNPDNPDGRTIVLCCVLTRKNASGGLETSNFYLRVNYKPEQLTDENIARIRAIRKQSAKMDSADYGVFLNIQKLRQMEILAGAELSMNGHGFDVTPLVGKYADFRIKEGKPNAEGKIYMEIAEIAPQGTKVK